MTDMYVAKVPDKTILDMLSELKERYGACRKYSGLTVC